MSRMVRSEKLNLRLTSEAKKLITDATNSLRRSVSDFVLESALARAEETLPDRRHFRLNDTQWAAFMAALDAPPRTVPRMKRLLNEPSIFETDSNPDGSA